MRFSAWYGLAVGVLMFGQWTFFIAAGQVPELQTEPYRIAFHLVAEAVTAVLLLVGGVGLLRARSWARDVSLLGHGLLVYTAIVSPGYFAQTGEWPLVAMFGVVLVLTFVSIGRLVRSVE